MAQSSVQIYIWLFVHCFLTQSEDHGDILGTSGEGTPESSWIFAKM